VARKIKLMGATAELPNRTFRKLYLTILFCIFLSPLSLNVGGEGVSANYLFILFPVSVALVSGKLLLPSLNFRNIIFLYILIFIVSNVYQFSYFQFMDRRVASFIIFMSMFAYTFIKIDSQMVSSFKLAIVVIAIIFSLESIFTYFSLGGANLGDSAKGAMGSQRYGFIYVLAIWLLFYYSTKYMISAVAKYIGLLVVGGGLMLTFSRSGIVALFASMTIYMIYTVIGLLKKPKLLNATRVWRAGLFVLILVAIIYVNLTYFQVVFDYYGTRLFSFTEASGVPVYNFDDEKASEGFRVFMFHKIVEYIIYNPFTGSGYLGVWILFDDLSGSAHNQYLDVLFRTGVFGFLAYVYLLYSLLRSFHLKEPSFFWGLISMLIYGIVHETFKLSHGMFILAFMLGIMMQYLRPANNLDSYALSHSQLN
jgi:O-antigen ligase